LMPDSPLVPLSNLDTIQLIFQNFVVQNTHILVKALGKLVILACRKQKLKENTKGNHQNRKGN
jgi:hypothetical protein